MAGELTVSERILYHLSNYTKYEDKYESPFDVTQDGISQACAISRAHAAIELKKLKASGIVDERLSHVRRGKSRRKVYFLTFAGKANAKDVLQYVRDNGIAPAVDPSRVSPESTGRERKAKRSSPLPTVREFFGRKTELREVGEALADAGTKIVAVKGIPGIGKTTLVAKAVSEITGQRVFWYSAKPWDSGKVLADSLGRFFSDNGGRKLAAYLASGKFELGELSFLLSEELAENGYTFVFDDADSSSGLQEFLRMFRHSSGSAKIVVASEHDPGFYESSDKVARKEVRELELGGLDVEASLQLLKTRGIDGQVARELVKVTNGHPLSLEMVTESSPVEAKYQVSRYFEEKFYSALSQDEKSLIQLASVFQRPFPPDAIPRDLKQARKGSMLREVAPGRFEIHASLRDFVCNAMTKDERSSWHSVAADYYLRTGDAQERLYHLINANRRLEAEMLMARSGESLLGDGNVQRLWEAVSRFEPAKPKYREQVRLLKARIASLAGHYDLAWSQLKVLSREEDAFVKAESLVEMGKIRSKKGELEPALRLFTEALDAGNDSPSIRAKALRGMGVVEAKLGDYGKAQELLERSAVDAMAAMDSKAMLMAHMELGNVFIGRGMYEEAIGHFSKCAAGFGPVELANVYVNMGVASQYLGRPEEARLHLENAVQLADSTGQPRSKAYALTSLADVKIISGKPEEAREHCFHALEILTELGDRIGISAAYANLGIAERVLGNLSSGEEYFKESIQALDGMDVPKSLGQRMLEYGILLMQKNDLRGARKALEESVSLFNGIDAKDLSDKAEKALVEIDRSLKSR
ncbi:MAG TPA: tetratricopeptide repeat protein [Thermoplasmata archaeon]